MNRWSGMRAQAPLTDAGSDQAGVARCPMVSGAVLRLSRALAVSLPRLSRRALRKMAARRC